MHLAMNVTLGSSPPFEYTPQSELIIDLDIESNVLLLNLGRIHKKLASLFVDGETMRPMQLQNITLHYKTGLQIAQVAFLCSLLLLSGLYTTITVFCQLRGKRQTYKL